MKHPRIVGVDYGTKRVGLAVSDPLLLFAQPVGTFSPADAVAEIRGIEAEDGVEVLVIGWPLTEEGKEGVATTRVNEYVRRLRNAVKGIRIVRWDERYTTESARDTLQGPVERGRLDTAAAGIILQEYLDARAKTSKDGD